MFQNFTPPVFPSDTALAAAVALLQTASDPGGTKARLTELVEQMQAVRDSIDEHEAAAKKADESRAALATVLEHEKAVNEREQAVAQAQTQAAVASAALASREQELNKRASELEKVAGEMAAREKALAAKLASYRQALA